MNTTEDLESIRQLLAQYCIAADQCRFEDWVALFGEDGVMHAFRRDWAGREMLMSFITNAPEGIHLNTSLQIELDGGQAKVLSNFAFYNLDMELGSMGIYDDDLVRTEGGWRFARREIQIAKPVHQKAQ